MSPTSSLSPSLLQHKGSMISPQCQPCSIRRGSVRPVHMQVASIWASVTFGAGWPWDVGWCGACAMWGV